jgi:biopolymer transport protein ExbD
MSKRVLIRRVGPEDEQILEGSIDLVFLLLLFLVIMSSFQVLVGSSVHPPKKLDQELLVDNDRDIILKVDPTSQVVAVFRKQQYPLAMESLFQDGLEKLKVFLSLSREAKVVVLADYGSNFGVVNTLELICTQLGITPYICYERGQT